MQTHTIKVKLEADGELVLRDLPFARGDEVVVRFEEPGVLPPLPEGFEQMSPAEQTAAVRESLRGTVAFADDWDPAAPAYEPERWHAPDPGHAGP